MEFREDVPFEETQDYGGYFRIDVAGRQVVPYYFCSDEFAGNTTASRTAPSCSTSRAQNESIPHPPSQSGKEDRGYRQERRLSVIFLGSPCYNYLVRII